jgi:hypothetical protein
MNLSRTGSIASRCLLVTAVAIIVAGVSAAADREVGWTEFLQNNGFSGNLSDLSTLRSHRVYQVSSFDRTGGNADGSFHLEKTEEGLLLAELDGPGAILRIWSPDPKGVLRFYIDGEPWPRFSRPFEKLFKGHIVPFDAPLVDEQGGGFYSYLPIPFEESCDIVLEGTQDNVPYQITACRFDDDVEGLKSYEPHVLNNADRYYLYKMRRTWERPGRFGMPLGKCELRRVKRLLWPRDVLTLADFDGPGIIEGLWIELESRDTECDKQMSLECFWDEEDEPSVSAIMADLFGTRNSRDDYRSLPMGNRDGQMYSYLPMPFRSHARLMTRNTTREKVIVKAWVAWRPVDDLDDNAAMLHAQTRKTAAETGSAFTVFDAIGRGQYIGCIVSASNPSTLKFLEGDEQIFVDDELVPSLHGTGTADYFNSSAQFGQGLFTTGTHGATALDMGSGMNYFTAYRFHITDYVPFEDSFHMQFEHGPENDTSGTTYQTTAFWYQTEPHASLGVETAVPAPPPPPKRLVKLLERHVSVFEKKAAEARAAEKKEEESTVIKVTPAAPESVAPSGS